MSEDEQNIWRHLARSIVPAVSGIAFHPPPRSRLIPPVALSPAHKRIKYGSMAGNLPACHYAHPRFPAGRFFCYGELFTALRSPSTLTSSPIPVFFLPPGTSPKNSRTAWVSATNPASPPPCHSFYLAATQKATHSERQDLCHQSSNALIAFPHFTHLSPKNSIPNITLLSAGASPFDRLHHHPTVAADNNYLPCHHGSLVVATFI